MDTGLPRHASNTGSTDPIQNPYALWVRDTLELAYDQVRSNAHQTVRRQKHLYDQRGVKRMFTVGYCTVQYYPLAKKCKLDSPWLAPTWLCRSADGRLVSSYSRTLPCSLYIAKT